jgi:hypothetical protein
MRIVFHRAKKPMAVPTPHVAILGFLTFLFGFWWGSAVFVPARNGEPQEDFSVQVADRSIDCVPRLVIDNTRDSSVLTQFGDKVLDTVTDVAASDAGFTLDAKAAVADLTVTFNPPLVVPGGGTLTVPPPNWTKAAANTSGSIVCSVAQDDTCIADLLTTSIPSAENGSAGIATRVEYEKVRPDEVRVRFQAKSAIDGGAPQEHGVYRIPPLGAVTFTNNAKSVTPDAGSATWECLVLL